MPDKLEEAISDLMAVFLPEILQNTLRSYHEFMTQAIRIDTKTFAGHHSAGKAAAAHIDILLKLMKRTRRNGFADEEESLERLMEKARIDFTQNNELV